MHEVIGLRLIMADWRKKNGLTVDLIEKSEAGCMIAQSITS